MKKRAKASITLEASISAYLIITLIILTFTVSSAYLLSSKFQNSLNSSAQIISSMCSVAGDDESIIAFLKTADVCDGGGQCNISREEFNKTVIDSVNIKKRTEIVDKLLKNSDQLAYTLIKLVNGEIDEKYTKSVTQLVCHAYFLNSMGATSISEVPLSTLIDYKTLDFSNSIVNPGDTIELEVDYTCEFILPIDLFSEKKIVQRSCTLKW